MHGALRDHVPGLRTPTLPIRPVLGHLSAMTGYPGRPAARPSANGASLSRWVHLPHRDRRPARHPCLRWTARSKARRSSSRISASPRAGSTVASRRAAAAWSRSNWSATAVTRRCRISASAGARHGDANAAHERPAGECAQRSAGRVGGRCRAILAAQDRAAAVAFLPAAPGRRGAGRGPCAAGRRAHAAQSGHPPARRGGRLGRACSPGAAAPHPIVTACHDGREVSDGSDRPICPAGAGNSWPADRDPGPSVAWCCGKM